MMEQFFLDNRVAMEAILRILIASFCGAAFGMERSHRQKEAGLRTHVIVAVGSALAMVVSKYGFNDVIITEAARVDASRVASNILTSISFLGAGIIFVRRDTITGLTTAAGIWATAAVGLCIGSGMYALGIFTTLFLVLIQIISHRWLNRFEHNQHDTVDAVLLDGSCAMQNLLSQLDARGIGVTNMTMERDENQRTIHVVITTCGNRTIKAEDVVALMEENREIVSINS